MGHKSNYRAIHTSQAMCVRKDVAQKEVCMNWIMDLKLRELTHSTVCREEQRLPAWMRAEGIRHFVKKERHQREFRLFHYEIVIRRCDELPAING